VTVAAVGPERAVDDLRRARLKTGNYHTSARLAFGPVQQDRDLMGDFLCTRETIIRRVVAAVLAEAFGNQEIGGRISDGEACSFRLGDQRLDARQTCLLRGDLRTVSAVLIECGDPVSC